MFREQGFFLTADDHDRTCALLSHLPHVIANAFASQVYRENQDLTQFAGSSFRDLTRIAGSSPGIWLDIFLTNRHQIIDAIREFERELECIRNYIESQDEDGLMDFLLQIRNLKEQVGDHDLL